MKWNNMHQNSRCRRHGSLLNCKEGNEDMEGLSMQQKLVPVGSKLGNKANKAPSKAVRMFLTHKACQK
jgi:hypothetical protein